MVIDGDPLFAYFVSLVETSDSAMTVTLAVRGALIGGTLIGSVAYVDGLAKLLPAAIPDEQMSAQWRQALRDAAATGRGAIDQEATRVDYAHLRDVQIVDAGGQPMTYPYWRVRLAAIDGWAFGAAPAT